MASKTCEWNYGDCRNASRTQVPYTPNGKYSTLDPPPTETLSLCSAHERIHAHEVLLSCLGEAGKWALGYLIREMAQDVYDDRCEEEGHFGG